MQDRLEALRARIAQVEPVRAVGRVHEIDTTAIWLRGLSEVASLGDRLRLLRRSGEPLEGEVLRIRDDLEIN